DRRPRPAAQPARHDHPHAPGRRDAHGAARHARERGGAVHRRAAAPRLHRRVARRRGRRPRHAAAPRRRLPRAHREGRRVARGTPPLGRAHPRHRGAPAAPRRADRLRAGDRGRLLLRLRRRPAVHARRPRAVRGGDAARRGREVPVRARGGEPRGGAPPLHRRPAQARAHRRPRRRRDDLGLHRRALRRPVPRAARAGHVVPQALQAAHHRRRVLARRREAADAAAHLRHGVLQEGRPRRAPAPDRGGEAARPPRAREAARPVQLLPGGPRRRLLDAARHHALQHARRLRPGAAARRVPRDQDAARVHEAPLGAVRPLGEVPREHVPDPRQRDRGARHVAQADELPVPLRLLQRGQALVPRAAAPPDDDGRAPPERALGRAVGAHARAAVLAGRLPRLPARGPDRRGGPLPPRLHPRPLPHVRPRRDAQVRDAARAAHRLGRAVGPRRGRPARGARGHRHALRDEAGRRRVLRAEDRLRRHRLDRARVAARHDPARLQRARAVRHEVRGRRQRRAPPGGHPPRGERLVRALHRDPHRALRGELPHLARARAGHRDPAGAGVHGLRRARGRGAARGRRARRLRRGEHGRLPRAHPRGVGAEGALHGGARRPRGRGGHGHRAPARGGEAAGDRAARRLRRAHRRRDPDARTLRRARRAARRRRV
ncbi:MAG: Threonyl-tRNA synthetase, partial [uncultured Gemmatimonadaceae bacterium]